MCMRALSCAVGTTSFVCCCEVALMKRASCVVACQCQARCMRSTSASYAKMGRVLFRDTPLSMHKGTIDALSWNCSYSPTPRLHGTFPVNEQLVDSIHIVRRRICAMLLRLSCSQLRRFVFFMVAQFEQDFEPGRASDSQLHWCTASRGPLSSDQLSLKAFSGSSRACAVVDQR